MATGFALKELIDSYPLTGNFEPSIHHCPESDTLTFYFRDAPDYAKRLGKHVTLYLSLANDELVGCQIKGVRGVVESLPNFIEIRHGKVKLRFLFMAFMGDVDEQYRSVYSELGKYAEDRELELESV
jgi:hypothetical protein